MFFLGFGIEARILAVVIQSFAIVNMNSATGFLNVELLRHELMQSLRANRLQTFTRVVFPSALPDVFTGMKLCGIFATTACIVEFLGAQYESAGVKKTEEEIREAAVAEFEDQGVTKEKFIQSDTEKVLLK